MSVSLPSAVLLPYQAHAVGLLDARGARGQLAHRVLVWEKSRRIGATWALAALTVLRAAKTRAAGGMNVYYIGFNRDMTQEFVGACADWAREFARLALDVEETVFEDGDKSIQAFAVKFASGHQLTALCSRPRSLRGRQGLVIIDEAAFHDELGELLKAALALLMWGGQVIVLSTHDGADNPFAELVDDCRARRKPFTVLRTTFEDAVREGVYRRVCLRLGVEWTAEGERAWVQETRDFYGEDADEELDVIPRQGRGVYLPRTLIEARATAAPVVRWALPDEFVDYGEERRFRECQDWIEQELAPLVSALPSGLRSSLGEDFGRSGDLTVLWPLTTEQDLTRHTPFVVELRNIPFRQQEQIVFWLCDHLPRFSGAAFDARGNGQYLAEVTRQRYGAERVAEVMLTESWYREHVPPLKAALEDGTFDLPRDADLADDFRSVTVVRGVPRVPDKARKGANGQRHGDGFVAAALALFASSTLDAGPLEFSTAGSFVSHAAFGGVGGAAGGPGY